MNDPEALRDYLIADEIQRIEALSREELVRELISVKSERLEVATLAELLKVCQSKNGT
jgi:hypothetical protein